MKGTKQVTVAVLAVLLVLAVAQAADAGHRGPGGFFISAPGFVISTGRFDGVSVFVSGGGPGFYFNGRYGPRRGYYGYRPHRHRPRHYWGGHYPPRQRHHYRWERPPFGPYRDMYPKRKWTSRTWVPGRMTSRGFVGGYWEERPLSP